MGLTTLLYWLGVRVLEYGVYSETFLQPWETLITIGIPELSHMLSLAFVGMGTVSNEMKKTASCRKMSFVTLVFIK